MVIRIVRPFSFLNLSASTLSPPFLKTPRKKTTLFFVTFHMYAATGTVYANQWLPTQALPSDCPSLYAMT